MHCSFGYKRPQKKIGTPGIYSISYDDRTECNWDFTSVRQLIISFFSNLQPKIYQQKGSWLNFILVAFAMFGAILYYPGYTTTIIFGTLKDGSLKISNLPLNNCFSYWNVLQNGVKALWKMILFLFFFFSKSSKFCTFPVILYGFNFASMWSKYVSCNIRRDFTLPMSAFAFEARKSFNGEFTAKIDFPTGHFM